MGFYSLLDALVACTARLQMHVRPFVPARPADSIKGYIHYFMSTLTFSLDSLRRLARI